MVEQTDWYERGCSRSCRNKHTNVWGWCELAEKPAPTLNLSITETFTASDGNTSVKIRQATAGEAQAELDRYLVALAEWDTAGRGGGENHG